jgi:hypothetical protein
MKKSFKAKLSAHGPKGAWVFLDVPFDVLKTFGSRARVLVRGTRNGVAFRNSLMPNGDGTHSMPVNKSLQSGAKVRAGDSVRVVLELDHKKRIIKVPSELKAAFKSDPSAAAIYKTLSPSHQQEFAVWIERAKQPATRLARTLKLILVRAHTR